MNHQTENRCSALTKETNNNKRMRSLFIPHHSSSPTSSPITKLIISLSLSPAVCSDPIQGMLHPSSLTFSSSSTTTAAASTQQRDNGFRDCGGTSTANGSRRNGERSRRFVAMFRYTLWVSFSPPANTHTLFGFLFVFDMFVVVVTIFFFMYLDLEENAILIFTRDVVFCWRTDEISNTSN